MKLSILEKHLPTLITFTYKDNYVEVDEPNLAEALFTMQQYFWNLEFYPYTRIELDFKTIDLMYPCESTDEIPITITQKEPT